MSGSGNVVKPHAAGGASAKQRLVVKQDALLDYMEDGNRNQPVEGEQRATLHDDSMAQESERKLQRLKLAG